MGDVLASTCGCWGFVCSRREDEGRLCVGSCLQGEKFDWLLNFKDGFVLIFLFFLLFFSLVDLFSRNRREEERKGWAAEDFGGGTPLCSRLG